MLALFLTFWPLWRLQRWIIILAATWLLSALALWVAARLSSNVQVKNYGAALRATVVILLVNALLGPVFRFLLFPLTALTLGLFLVVINAMLLKVASWITQGFKLRGFSAALLLSLALSAVKLAVPLALGFFSLGRW